MGRRRKRRKPLKRVVRKIPTIFICPHCSRQSLKITIKRSMGSEEAIAEAVCGECGLCAKFKIPSIMQPVDAYGKLVDLYDSYEGDINELISSGKCLGDAEETEGVKETIGENSESRGVPEEQEA